LDIVWVYGDLMVSSHEINFGKSGAARKAVGIFLYVWDWVPVGNGASIKSSVVSTESPAAVLFGHEMEGGQPWALGASGCTIPQHDVESGLGHSQTVRSKEAWAAGY
jgi:hypothetical protein